MIILECINSRTSFGEMYNKAPSLQRHRGVGHVENLPHLFFLLSHTFYVIVVFASGSGGGFFYLMCTGQVRALPSPMGFDKRYVLLDDASFFEVSGPLGAQGNEHAARLRGVFRARAGVLRIVYAASVRPRSIEAMVRQVRRSTWHTTHEVRVTFLEP